jgi:hypothetical protein
MPCNFLRSAAVGFGFAVLLFGGSLTSAPAQQERENARPVNPIDRWNQMSPEQRERELAKLPPARQRAIRQQLRRYNQMPPEERQKLRERYQTFAQLPPAQQQIVRQRLREFRQLPPQRQPVVHRQVEQLRRMTEAQRQENMNSEEFQGRFSPQEQQIIRDLTEYLQTDK